MEVASVTEIKPTEPGAEFDVYAEGRRRGEKVPEFAGDQLLEVRAYEVKQGEGRKELAGAHCSLKSIKFSAEATTPAKVRVPLYRNQQSTLAVTCHKPGYKSRMIESHAFDATKSGRLASGSAGGVVGVVFMAAVNAASDDSKNVWLYSPISVVLEAETAVAAQ